MLVKDFLTLLYTKVGDDDRIVFGEPEMMMYLNDAITQLSLERIAAGDQSMIVTMTVVPSETPVPAGFVRFVGQEAVYIVNNVFATLDGLDVQRTVRYYGTKPRVSTKADEVPFDDTTSLGVLLNYATTAASARIGDAAQVEAQLAQRMSDAYTGRVTPDADQGEAAR